MASSPAQNNVFALMDSLTGQLFAVVVDAANPPAAGSGNNAYWKRAITTQSANPLVAVPVAVAVYNAASVPSLLATLTTLFNTPGTAIALG